MSLSNDASEAIISRMRELRSTGVRDVHQLHAQVERVTDWREHVRAHPTASVVAASIIGFTLVRTITNSDRPPQQIVYSSAPMPASVAKPKSAMTGMLSVAGGMAASMARQWLAQYVKKQLGVYANAAGQSTNDARQRSSSGA